MSKSSDISYTCPRCQKQSRFTIWQSINVDLDPSLKQKVMDGSLFVFHCLYCGFSQKLGIQFSITISAIDTWFGGFQRVRMVINNTIKWS
jgi:Zn ribbon nucleic-acid-binding protein